MKKRISAVQAMELRAEQNQAEEKTIQGYFALFNSPTELWAGVNEQIAQNAIRQIGDVRALINHDSTLVLGRTKSSTLELRTDEKGLFGIVKINENDRAALDLYGRVQRGDVDQCSFGFTILDEEYITNSDGSTLITLKEIELHEVSVCTFPAYPQTSVEARTADIKDHSEKMLERKKEELLRRIRNA